MLRAIKYTLVSVIFLGTSVCYSVINKIEPYKFEVSNEDSKKTLNIKGISGTVEYLAEVKNTDSGLIMYLVKNNNGVWYLCHQRDFHVEEIHTEEFHIQNLNADLNVLGASEESGLTYSYSGMIYFNPNHISHNELIAHSIDSLIILPNGIYHIPKVVTTHVNQVELSGNYEVIQEQSFD
ncbi:hypothetical protein NX722_03400 [Endozoicomonas gorgoniicola]|uniref:Uncharacterized protein n=1 Tax=Endozoicomonas gorgoniicola TaxID=1234144 RepID=A0ABT3MQQ1_9GAMM|nr:hypothetical protein [Endozoicomonas gorgoniicola]MCW7551704.1 hypothetical protein [Endozoicomonas gorgoniicola]